VRVERLLNRIRHGDSPYSRAVTTDEAKETATNDHASDAVLKAELKRQGLHNSAEFKQRY